MHTEADPAEQYMSLPASCCHGSQKP